MGGIGTKVKKFISNPQARFSYLSCKGFYNHMSDEKYLKKKFKLDIGKELDLESPTTFCEKIQWLKLYNRNPAYTMMADKYEVKKYIAETIGQQYVIPTYGVWDSFDDIDFDKLPNQFVLKCTHDSGGLSICKDKSEFDFQKAKRRINFSLQYNYYWREREWPYKNIKPRIIAERFMEDSNASEKNGIDKLAMGLLDYKFYCFNGTPKFLYVGFANIRNGMKNDMLSFYDLDWNPTPFYRKDHDPIPFQIEKPKDFDKMIDIARELSKDIPFVRVDLYYINGQIYFSELTFSPGGGFGPFFPYEWEEIIGEWITLPNLEKGENSL